MAPPAKKTKTEHVPTGDDLEDNFALDDDLVATAFSDQEAGDPADLSDDAAAVGGSDDEGDGDARPAKKRRADPSSSNDEAPAAGDASAAAAPKSKRAAKRAKDKKRAKVAEAGLDERDKDDMGLLPPEALADRLADKQRRALPNLSALELDEQRISQSMIHDTATVEARDSLLAFMKEALPTACNTLAKMPKATGSPRIIVVAGAALRVADLCRDVKSFKTKTKDGLIDVAKLFAKHFKLSEHVEYMKKTHVGLAVGTPNRIEKLLNESDALHLTHLSHLILDVSHLDSKKRSLVDLPEARVDLFKLLGSKPIMDRLREGKMKIVVF
ncbi:U3-containing 90S pre-ribosomal complex subunit-domain containing protein [Rhodotorula diobovata]|uniref:U3-containing 90S pre-ribosomal complex subunit-domain containing protein n=1 Tax=Rhodotorula diobovata TaxID=5288 RepID=A0A5C5G3B1_9BASI|nr:U3-containing 90S pre-ribosomal complex subunit-domain containing protein [Rhodotorula diobovata]